MKVLHHEDDPVQRLLDGAGRRKVRAVVRSDNEYADIIYDLAAGTRRHWDIPSWSALLRRLDETDLTVAEWLKERGHV